MEDKVHARGFVQIRIIQDGIVAGEVNVENMVVTSGLNYIADRTLRTPVMPLMSHMAIGTSGTAPVKANTALGSELARVALSTDPYQSLNQTVYEASFPAGIATGSISELGIFNAASGGTMLARVAFSAQTKESTTSFSVQWLVAYQ